ncbi:hypothetical protein CVN68_17655 [Sphingomonas psychrotolerans]|uniref:Uncharacterized protein n=1 Tax=Sphingomonas psychrotolerans TaxID=1327635 RepID=A0A2K8MKM8_9SPHN|nr:hypothetical protein CVN68_17655 [Sphingomonas psychrotolerans]
MKRRLFLLLPPLALAVPAPATGATIFGRFCGTQPAAPADPVPRKDPCATTCHAMPCERQRAAKRAG